MPLISAPKPPRPRGHRISPRAAFTPVEILVVTALLALLAAVLFPAFARARANARRSSCQSNLRQIGAGIAQYARDYDGHFPLGLAITGDARFGSSLELVQPYLQSFAVAICPADDEVPSVDLRLPGTVAVSYNGNQKIMTAYGLDPQAAAPPSLAQIRASARLPLMWDAVNSDSSPIGAAPFASVKVARRHYGGANCLFVDGHVKFVQSRPELWDAAKGHDYWDAAPNAR